MQFHKYHGTGNDFIVIDNRDHSFPHAGRQGQRMISQLCHRHMGIGADGLILIEEDLQADFSMRFFNADGLPGSFCGNGSRCATAFVFKHDIIPKKQLIFHAADGSHQASVIAAGKHQLRVRVTLRDVAAPKTSSTSHPFAHQAFFVDTGSPHVVIFANKIDKLDVPAEGERIRNDARWQPGGANVNFVEHIGNGKIYVRTYERGVENETLSCGSGVTASAIAAHHMKGIRSESVSVQTRGGELQVSFNPPQKKGARYTEVSLEGPATKVYTGKMPDLLLDG